MPILASILLIDSHVSCSDDTNRVKRRKVVQRVTRSAAFCATHADQMVRVVQSECPGCTVAVYDVTAGGRSGLTALRDALEYAFQNRFPIINISCAVYAANAPDILGGLAQTMSTEDVIVVASELRGCRIGTLGYPARLPGVVSVVGIEEPKGLYRYRGVRNRILCDGTWKMHGVREVSNSVAAARVSALLLRKLLHEGKTVRELSAWLRDGLPVYEGSLLKDGEPLRWIRATEECGVALGRDDSALIYPPSEDFAALHEAKSQLPFSLAALEGVEEQHIRRDLQCVLARREISAVDTIIIPGHKRYLGGAKRACELAEYCLKKGHRVVYYDFGEFNFREGADALERRFDKRFVALPKRISPGKLVRYFTRGQGDRARWRFFDEPLDVPMIGVFAPQGSRHLVKVLLNVKRRLRYYSGVFLYFGAGAEISGFDAIERAEQLLGAVPVGVASACIKTQILYHREARSPDLFIAGVPYSVVPRHWNEHYQLSVAIWYLTILVPDYLMLLLPRELDRSRCIEAVRLFRAIAGSRVVCVLLYADHDASHLQHEQLAMRISERIGVPCFDGVSSSNLDRVCRELIGTIAGQGEPTQ